MANFVPVPSWSSGGTVYKGTPSVTVYSVTPSVTINYPFLPCPDTLQLADLGAAGTRRGKVVRAFFYVLAKIWPVR